MANPSPVRSVLVLLGLLLLVFAVAALGGIATSSSVNDWYPSIAKPAWNPPSWLFGPVWTLLYIAMAVVAWRIWRLPASPARTHILRAWWFQIVLNGAWSWAFFYFRNPAAGLLVIGALLVVISWIQTALSRSDRPSALLWTPYVLWVGFASCLNLALWHLN